MLRTSKITAFKDDDAQGDEIEVAYAYNNIYSQKSSH